MPRGLYMAVGIALLGLIGVWGVATHGVTPTDTQAVRDASVLPTLALGHTEGASADAATAALDHAGLYFVDDDGDGRGRRGGREGRRGDDDRGRRRHGRRSPPRGGEDEGRPGHGDDDDPPPGRGDDDDPPPGGGDDNNPPPGRGDDDDPPPGGGDDNNPPPPPPPDPDPNPPPRDPSPDQHPPGLPPTYDCGSCHNGYPPGFNAPPSGIGKPAGHPNPNDDCTICHGPNAIVPGA